MAHSQNTLRHEKCDTINIDKCYMVVGDDKVKLDTNVVEEINGLFSFIKVEPLNPNDCMLYLTRTDTIFTVYDSTVINGSIVYLVDTFFSSKLYYVMVESEEDFNNLIIKRLYEYRLKEKMNDFQSELIPLHLKRFYQDVTLFHKPKESEERNLATTWSCEQCQVIILHGKEEKVYDCPLYNNLYRLK